MLHSNATIETRILCQTLRLFCQRLFSGRACLNLHLKWRFESRILEVWHAYLHDNSRLLLAYVAEDSHVNSIKTMYWRYLSRFRSEFRKFIRRLSTVMVRHNRAGVNRRPAPRSARLPAGARHCPRPYRGWTGHPAYGPRNAAPDATSDSRAGRPPIPHFALPPIQHAPAIPALLPLRFPPPRQLVA